MRKDGGFTLIELLIVVAIIGIIAAIAIPSLLRARVSANESQMIGDARTMESAEATYASAVGNVYGTPACLSTPNVAGCLGTTYSGPTFVDNNIGGTITKGGYVRLFSPGNPVTNMLTQTGLDAFCYSGTPLTLGQTGTRGFGVDSSGKLCQDLTGASPCSAGKLVTTCIMLQ